MYVRLPVLFRNAEDLLFERHIEISLQIVHFGWNMLGPIFVAKIYKIRVRKHQAYSNWQWQVDDVFAGISGETHSLCWAVDHQGEAHESCVAKRPRRMAY